MSLRFDKFLCKFDHQESMRPPPELAAIQFSCNQRKIECLLEGKIALQFRNLVCEEVLSSVQYCWRQLVSRWERV